MDKITFIRSSQIRDSKQNSVSSAKREAQKANIITRSFITLENHKAQTTL